MTMWNSMKRRWWYFILSWWRNLCSLSLFPVFYQDISLIRIWWNIVNRLSFFVHSRCYSIGYIGTFIGWKMCYCTETESKSLLQNKRIWNGRTRCWLCFVFKSLVILFLCFVINIIWSYLFSSARSRSPIYEKRMWNGQSKKIW